jgi:hypothetical protein
MLSKGETPVNKFHVRALWLAIMTTVSVVVGLCAVALSLRGNHPPEQVVAIGGGGFGGTMLLFFAVAGYLQGGGRDDE